MWENNRQNLGAAKPNQPLKTLVPVERIELPTFGLQNRCSTAELNRRFESDPYLAESSVDSAGLSAGRIPDRLAKGQRLLGRSGSSARMKKAALEPPFRLRLSEVYWHIC